MPAGSSTWSAGAPAAWPPPAQPPAAATCTTRSPVDRPPPSPRGPCSAPNWCGPTWTRRPGRAGHVSDPFTARPPTALASVTVLGPELVWADVYATAGLARGGQSYGWLNSLTGYEHCVVTADGQQRHSAGWPALRVGPSR